MYRKKRHFKDPTLSKVKTIRSRTNFILGGINYKGSNPNVHPLSSTFKVQVTSEIQQFKI